MAQIDAGQLRRGLAIMVDNAPHILLGVEFVKPVKGQALYKCRLKNIRSGVQFDRTFRSGDRFDVADVTESQMQYLYSDGSGYNFMLTDTYETFPVDKDVVGEAKNFLKENMVVNGLLYDGSPVAIELPNFVELEVTYAEPWLKGDTAAGSTKPVTVETGYQVQVPLFVAQGDRLRIDTRSGEYVERVKK